MPTYKCSEKGSRVHTSLHSVTEGKYIHLCDGGGPGASLKGAPSGWVSQRYADFGMLLMLRATSL